MKVSFGKLIFNYSMSNRTEKQCAVDDIIYNVLKTPKEEPYGAPVSFVRRCMNTDIVVCRLTNGDTIVKLAEVKKKTGRQIKDLDKLLQPLTISYKSSISKVLKDVELYAEKCINTAKKFL